MHESIVHSKIGNKGEGIGKGVTRSRMAQRNYNYVMEKRQARNKKENKTKERKRDSGSNGRKAELLDDEYKVGSIWQQCSLAHAAHIPSNKLATLPRAPRAERVFELSYIERRGDRPHALHTSAHTCTRGHPNDPRRLLRFLLPAESQILFQS